MPLTIRRLRHTRGVTLVEVMVAVTIMTVGVLAYFSTFQFITKSSHNATAVTLASNIAQAQLEDLKSQNYYSVQITTETTWIYYVRGYPIPTNWYHLLVDNVTYPKTKVTLSGITFYRFTSVAFVQYNPISGATSGTTSTYPDTGVKQVQIFVGWCEPGEPCNGYAWWHMQSATGLMLNPNLDKYSAKITGTVRDALSSNPLYRVKIKTAENPSLGASSDINGLFSFNVTPGTYTLTASLSKYSPATSASYYVGAQATQNVTIVMTPLDTGKVTGNIWLNEELVISQVVAAKNTKTYWTYPSNNDSATFDPLNPTVDVSYIELFNPTTYTISVSAPDHATPNNFYLNMAHSATAPNSEQFANTFFDVMQISSGLNPNYSQFVTTFIPPRGYYLIANYPAFDVGSPPVRINADAYWYNSPPTAMPAALPKLNPTNMGAVQICRYNAATCPTRYAPCTPCPSLIDSVSPSDPHTAPLTRDQVCWSGTTTDGAPALTVPTQGVWGWCHHAPIPTACGLQTNALGGCDSTSNGDQLLRFSYPDPNPLLVPTSCADVESHLQRPIYGPGYQTFFGRQDFSYPSATNPFTIGSNCFLAPKNSSVFNQTVIGGLPAFDFRAWPYSWGGSIAATVRLSTDSSSTQATPTVVTQTNFLGNTQYYSSFTIVDASTGTWTTQIAYYQSLSGYPPLVASNQYIPSWYNSYIEVRNTQVSVGAEKRIVNDVTVPPWQVLNHNDVILQKPPSSGSSSISGFVYDINGNPIPNITVTAYGLSVQTTANGQYYIPLPNYVLINLVINPNNLNPNYVSQQYHTQILVGGMIIPTFFLPNANVAIGKMTTDAVAGLPNQAVAATIFGGMTAGSIASDSLGFFYVRNLSTGDVTFSPILSPGQSSTPLSQTVNISGSGGNIWVATFTISGALGKLSGSVRDGSGALIKSGALIIASTGALTNAMTATPASNTAPVFTTWSDGDGKYSLSAGAVNNYNVRVWVPLATAGGASAAPCIHTYVANVNISATGTVQDLTCP